MRGVHPSGRLGPVVGAQRLAELALLEEPRGIGQVERCIGNDPGQKDAGLLADDRSGEQEMGERVHELELSLQVGLLRHSFEFW